MQKFLLGTHRVLAFIVLVAGGGVVGRLGFAFYSGTLDIMMTGDSLYRTAGQFALMLFVAVLALITSLVHKALYGSLIWNPWAESANPTTKVPSASSSESPTPPAALATTESVSTAETGGVKPAPAWVVPVTAIVSIAFGALFLAWVYDDSEDDAASYTRDARAPAPAAPRTTPTNRTASIDTSPFGLTCPSSADSSGRHIHWTEGALTIKTRDPGQADQSVWNFPPEAIVAAERLTDPGFGLDAFHIRFSAPDVGAVSMMVKNLGSGPIGPQMYRDKFGKAYDISDYHIGHWVSVEMSAEGSDLSVLRQEYTGCELGGLGALEYNPFIQFDVL